MESSLLNRVLDTAVAIQQIPAPTFEEGQRAVFLRNSFQNEGLCDVSMDEVGNVYGRLPGIGAAPPLVVSAHSDTVFPAATNLKVRREQDRIYGPGIGDNSLGVAGLFGLLWVINQRRIELPGDLWLVANVGEEGLGDLRGMRAVVERFGAQVLAYLVVEGMALGQIYHRGLGVRRYRIRVQTSGGHSWVDYGQPSAVHELAMLIGRLNSLDLPKQPRTTLNVGVIAGGTSVNTIAAEAHLELDLRSESVRTLHKLIDQVKALVAAANREGVQVTAEVIGDRPAGKISPEHALVQLARRCLEAQGFLPNLGIGSTDANIPLSRGIPAICLGISMGGNAHTVNEYINLAPVEKGLDQLVAVVQGAYQDLSQNTQFQSSASLD
jgi:tripeptide aminopeptidase